MFDVQVSTEGRVFSRHIIKVPKDPASSSGTATAPPAARRGDVITAVAMADSVKFTRLT